MTQRPDQRYPLTWPTGWPRTSRWARGYGPFKVSAEVAYRELLQELERLGARNIIISSNLKLRQDGYPYANQPRHDDEGIAVYFTRKGKDQVLACDNYVKREQNMRAITKTIEALRGIARWGATDMMERAFEGFTALPAPLDWRDTLGFAAGEAVTLAEAEARYRRRVTECHPDRMGESFNDAMADLNAARDAAREELGPSVE